MRVVYVSGYFGLMHIFTEYKIIVCTVSVCLCVCVFVCHP